MKEAGWQKNCFVYGKYPYARLCVNQRWDTFLWVPAGRLRWRIIKGRIDGSPVFCNIFPLETHSQVSHALIPHIVHITLAHCHRPSIVIRNNGVKRFVACCRHYSTHDMCPKRVVESLIFLGRASFVWVSQKRHNTHCLWPKSTQGRQQLSHPADCIRPCVQVEKGGCVRCGGDMWRGYVVANKWAFVVRRRCLCCEIPA